MFEGGLESTTRNNIFRDHILPRDLEGQREMVQNLKVHDSLEKALDIDGDLLAQKIEEAFSAEQSSFSNRQTKIKAKKLEIGNLDYAEDLSVRDINYLDETGEQTPVLVRKFSFIARNGRKNEVLQIFAMTKRRGELPITDLVVSSGNLHVNLADLLPKDTEAFYLMPAFLKSKPIAECQPPCIDNDEDGWISVTADSEQTDHATFLHETGHAWQSVGENRGDLSTDLSGLPKIDYRCPLKSYRVRRKEMLSRVKTSNTRRIQMERNAWAFAAAVYKKCKDLGIDLEPKMVSLKKELRASLMTHEN
jgi:hypothetical protein